MQHKQKRARAKCDLTASIGCDKLRLCQLLSKIRCVNRESFEWNVKKVFSVVNQTFKWTSWIEENF